MVERVILNQAQPPPLEQRIVGILSNGNAGSEALAKLIGEVEKDIASVDEDIAAMRGRASDLIATPDTKTAQQAVLDADMLKMHRDRFVGVLPKLRSKLSAALATERRSKWLGFFELVEAEREKLAAEFDAARSRVKAELAALNSRIKQFNAEARYVNNMADEIGECRDLNLLPLFAKLQTLDADEASVTPDWQGANSFAASFAQSMSSPAYDPARWSDPDVQAQRRVEIEKQHREMADHFAEQTKTQEERQNREEKERFAASRRTP